MILDGSIQFLSAVCCIHNNIQHHTRNATQISSGEINIYYSKNLLLQSLKVS